MTEAPDKPATIDPPGPADKAPMEFMADISDALDAMDAGKPIPEAAEPKSPESKPQPKAKPTPQPAKPEPAKAEVPKPEAETPKPDAQKEPEAKPVKAAELRNAYEGLKKRVREELEPEVQKLKSKVQEYEARKPEDTTPLLEKIKTLEQRKEDLERAIQVLDYTQSEEYQSKVEVPYRDAWNRALRDFRELDVIERTPDGEDEDGKPTFKTTTRPATEHDLIKFSGLNLSEIHRLAKQMFDDASPTAVSHVLRLRELAEARSTAIKEGPERAKAWKAQQALASEQRGKTMAKLWMDTTKALQERLPKAYQPEEGNEVDQQAHARGFALADLLFLGESALRPEQIEQLPEGFKETVQAQKPLSDEQRVKLHALAHLKIGNHDRLLARDKVSQGRIKELETALGQYEKSAPDTSKVADASEKTMPEDPIAAFNAEIDKLDR